MTRRTADAPAIGARTLRKLLPTVWPLPPAAAVLIASPWASGELALARNRPGVFGA